MKTALIALCKGSLGPDAWLISQNSKQPLYFMWRSWIIIRKSQKMQSSEIFYGFTDRLKSGQI